MSANAAATSTRELTKLGLMIALQCVSCYIIIPLPFSMSPIALVTMIVNLNGMVLSVKQSVTSMAAYLLLGLAGLPIFTGGASGPGKLFGPTGGYLFGWLVAAALIAYFRPQKYDFKKYALLGCLISIPVIYLPGVLQLNFLTHMGMEKAIMTGALPFIPLDIVKAMAAAYIAGPILKIFNRE